MGITLLAACARKPEYRVCAYVWPSCHDDSLAHQWLWADGEGEWEVIKKGNPRFEGHYQPKRPLWGYGLDNDPAVVEKWIQTALKYGVNTFVYDWYWYNAPDGYHGPYLESALNDGFLKAPSNRKMDFFLMYANHDVNNSGFTLEQKKQLIAVIEPHMKVYISSEKELPDELQAYRLHTPANKIHHVLAYADLYLGDSQTMATEAALLGTPAIRSNSFVGPNDMTNFKVLEQQYGLLFNIREFDGVLAKVQEMACESKKSEWQAKQHAYFEKVGDANQQIVEMLRDL